MFTRVHELLHILSLVGIDSKTWLQAKSEARPSERSDQLTLLWNVMRQELDTLVFGSRTQHQEASCRAVQNVGSVSP